MSPAGEFKPKKRYPMKKALLTVVLAIAAVMCILLYFSAHETFKADDPDLDAGAKLADLRRAQSLDPLNEKSFEQEGLTLLSRGVDNLADFQSAQADILRAYQSLRKALRLNPGSATTHYYYAKTLSLMKYLGQRGEGSAFQEFQNAARLSGPNRQLSKTIGMDLLRQWGSLSAEEKQFAEDLMKRSLDKQDEASYRDVLYLWDLNIHDYAVMDNLTPESPALLRLYAQFLGEKSLSLEARHKALARAESLDYDQAWNDYETAQNLNKYGQTSDVVEHLLSCLTTLDRIKFFGLLTEAEKVGLEIEKKSALVMAASLDLAKARLDTTRKLDEARGPLRTYLALETNFNQVTALESFLKELRIIPESEGELSFRDIPQLSFEIYLMFKLHKYRQIISLGSQLQRTLLTPDPAVRKDLSEIFQLVGDSYLKLDFVYESEGFYEKALELTPRNIEVLFRLKRYFERRNDLDKMQAVDRQLTPLLSTGQVGPQRQTIPKEGTYDQALVLDLSQKRVRLEFKFETFPENARPLVGVYLNDRVQWENYLAEPSLVLELDCQEGINKLRVIAVNGPVILAGLGVSAPAAPPLDLQSSPPNSGGKIR